MSLTITVNQLMSDQTSYAMVIDGDTIFASAEFKTYVRAKWGTMLFLPDTDNAMSEFKGIFDSWKNLVGPDIHRIWEAMMEEYRPLENYYREELGSEKDELHKGSKTSTASDVVSTPTVKTENNSSTYAYNSTSAVPDGKHTSETVSGTNRTTAAIADNYTTTTDLSDTVFDHNVHTFIDRVTRGNVGVTSSQQMLEQELAIRMKKYLCSIIDSFVLEFTMYVKGVD